MSDQVADIIDQAADYLESHGWWRGNLRGLNGRQVCVVGAFKFSQGWEHDGLRQNPQGEEVQNALLRVIGKEFGLDGLRRWWSIEHWNDQVARDKQHVLNVMRKAAKWERAGYDPDA